MNGLAVGSILAGKYRLERPLAQGGMGSVWAAFDTQLEVPVAVKFMAPALAGSADLVARFEREAKAAAQLRSPHVVQVFEHGADAGVPYIVMERLDGEDLGARLKARGRLSLREAADVLTQVCKALRRAHEAGVVHRDLKPANIFLARHDEDEIVKVLDFGIAKSGEPSARGDGTRTGVMMGSPSYMSPEQARSTKAVDHRSDLWSLGLVMFRAVTGRMAFVGETDADVIIKLCSDPVPVPSEVAPDLPPEVDAFFARALSRDVDKRFQSAREMAAVFGALVGRMPSLADAAPAAPAAPVMAAGGTAPMLAAPVVRTVELTAGDIERTLPLAQGAVPAEQTVPLPVAAQGEVPESAQQMGAAGSSTLTNATGATTQVGRSSRGRVTWALGACAVLGVLALGVFVIRMRSAPTDGAQILPSPAGSTVGSASPTSAVSSAKRAAAAVRVDESMPVLTASSRPDASAPTSAPPAPMPTASEPKVEPRYVSAKGAPAVVKAPAQATSASGSKAPAQGGLLEIPRVLGKESKP